MSSRFAFVPFGGPSPKPGDLVGFAGRGLVADLINLGTFGRPGHGLCHVGIVAAHCDQLALYESTTTVRAPCLETGKPANGLQCHPLADRVIGYKGRVWHYPLTRPLDNDIADGLEYRLRHFCREGIPYDYQGALDARSTLLALVLRLKHGEDLKQLFCSEFAAAVWRSLNRFDTKNASRWSPNGLAREGVAKGITGAPWEWLTAETIVSAAGRTS